MMRTVKLATLLVVGLTAVGWARAGGQVLSKEQFVAKAIDINLTEEDLAKRAVKNAQSAEVRKYAEHLIRDHEKLNRKPLEMAREMKLGVVTAASKASKDAQLKLGTARARTSTRSSSTSW